MFGSSSTTRMSFIDALGTGACHWRPAVPWAEGDPGKPWPPDAGCNPRGRPFRAITGAFEGSSGGRAMPHDGVTVSLATSAGVVA
jgi:hypothetical protein